MSNISLIIEERAAPIGQFMVGRLLPFRQKRMVGPFIYMDRMGPVSMSENENFDVLPHPHIGLSTLTYLFEGSIMHRDTMGNETEIKPGEVNWMTAGKAVAHSERTPDYLRNAAKSLFGLQIWVALPKELEEMEPEFFHIEKEDIPQWKQGNLDFKLIAGEAFGKKSPVPVYSKLFMIEIHSKSMQTLSIGNELYGEAGIYILKGSVITEGNSYDPNQILVAKDSKLCDITLGDDTVIFIFGGEPFPEKRYIHWNFVSSSLELIEKAKEKWKAQQFGKIRGETEFMPLPEPRK
ncbi:MAG: pirin family protein [Bacteroidetes bacterium]|nr:MAG: pirin family protein [Bacteroidota bacterium]